jgi:hypothetical protein
MGISIEAAVVESEDKEVKGCVADGRGNVGACWPVMVGLKQGMGAWLVER